MLTRISLFMAALGCLACLATTGCSSLTRPDPIQIAAEPAPVPQLRELPPMPAPGGAHAPAAPPAQGG